MTGGWQRLRAEGRDLCELVLLPGLAALLPWRWCFAIFKFAAGWSFLYRDACEHALHEAQARGWVEDAHAWLRARKLVTLIDHADLYLARSRSDAWMRRHLRVEGDWPAPGRAAVLCTFHWGAGMWGLRHAAASGLHPHALVAPLRAAHFAGRAICHRYARLRNATVARALGRAPLDVSASLRPALKALRAGEQVLAAVDVPADQVSASESIALLGMQARVPRALLRLAVEQRLPVTVYVTGIDLRNGQRFLRVRQLGLRDDTDALIRDVFAILEEVIREAPPAWHFWGEARRFFEPEHGS